MMSSQGVEDEQLSEGKCISPELICVLGLMQFNLLLIKWNLGWVTADGNQMTQYADIPKIPTVESFRKII